MKGKSTFQIVWLLSFILQIILHSILRYHSKKKGGFQFMSQVEDNKYNIYEYYIYHEANKLITLQRLIKEKLFMKHNTGKLH